MKNRDKNKKKDNNKLPQIKRDVSKLLNSEEARMSLKNILAASIAIVTLGYSAQEVVAAHTSHSSSTGTILHNSGGTGKHSSHSSHGSHGSHGQW